MSISYLLFFANALHKLYLCSGFQDNIFLITKKQTIMKRKLFLRLLASGVTITGGALPNPN